MIDASPIVTFTTPAAGGTGPDAGADDPTGGSSRTAPASTSMVNVTSAVAPPPSVAVQVYSVSAWAASGVPVTSRLAASRLTPPGSSGLNA